jgi:coenzyme F420-0:L-glutamate ligase/coenzyme F420-1:gamma-L-glutamate ligase
MTVLGVALDTEVVQGDDIPSLIDKAIREKNLGLSDGDVVAVTQKLVSKAEGRTAELDQHDFKAKLELIKEESTRIVRRKGELVIAETPHGFVCANAGIDASNVERGVVTLLPKDPDRSARRIQRYLSRSHDADIGVVITDTFGRAWRVGQVNIAIGCAGIEPMTDHRGTVDRYGNELVATLIATADELASAAELVMGKTKMTPIAVIRGSGVKTGRGKAQDLVRHHRDDLFR